MWPPGGEEQPCAPVADVQYAPFTVNDGRAARDVAGERPTVGRVVGAVQERRQPGEGVPFMRMPGQVRLGGSADVGAGERHVITSGRR